MKNLLLILFAVITACSSDGENPKPVYQVDPQFSIHVESFYAEALARGYGEFEKENLIVRPLDSDYMEDGRYVTGRYIKKHGQNIIEVRAQEKPNCYEAIVYRELIHLLADKAYNTTDDSKIMNRFFDPCTYVHVDGDFYEWERLEYLDELFGD